MSASFQIGGADDGTIRLEGATDSTEIGNLGNRLLVDAAITSISSASAPMINRTDVSTTVTTSGTSSALDGAGMSTLGFTVNVTAISGTSPTIQFYIEASDNGTNWSRYIDTRRMSSIDIQRMQGARLSGRYYRYGWIITGTSPSVTFDIVTTLKVPMPRRYTVRNNYSDLAIQTLGATSTVFGAADVSNVSLFTIRSDDGGSSMQYKVQASNDNFTWVDITGNISQARGTTVLSEFAGKAFRNYRLVVTAAANTSNTLDLFWAGGG